MCISDWSSDVCSSDLVDGDLARAWRQRAADQLQERGLAGAVSPDDADRLAPMDVEVQCAQCLEVPVPAIAMPGIEQLKQPVVRLAIDREGLRQPANPDRDVRAHPRIRSEEHTSELTSLMRISYDVFCLKKK